METIFTYYSSIIDGLTFQQLLNHDLYLLKRLLAFYRSSLGTERSTLREGLRTFSLPVNPTAKEETARLAILRLLVEWGGNLKDTLPLSKTTPLHEAVFFSNLGAVEFLIEKGADVNASAMGEIPRFMLPQLSALRERSLKPPQAFR